MLASKPKARRDKGKNGVSCLACQKAKRKCDGTVRWVLFIGEGILQGEKW
jgi:hypothetical protein